MEGFFAHLLSSHTLFFLPQMIGLGHRIISATHYLIISISVSGESECETLDLEQKKYDLIWR